MTSERHIKLGRLTALITFLLGTGIFGLYYFTSWSDLLFIGCAYIALVGIIYMYILFPILSRVSKDKINREKLLATSRLMLVNIPIMIAYIWVTTILLETMRITFTNHTGTKLKDIKIVGCGGGYIDKLENGESKTVWVKITGDCSIHINYLSNELRKKENVAGYVTSGMGQKMNHKIDGKDKDIIWNQENKYE